MNCLWYNLILQKVPGVAFCLFYASYFLYEAQNRKQTECHTSNLEVRTICDKKSSKQCVESRTGESNIHKLKIQLTMHKSMEYKLN